MFEFYRIVTRKFCTQLHKCFVEWNWAKDGMKKSFSLNIFNLIYRSQLYKLSETCFQFQFFYFSEMSSPQALREALCTKIFCSVKSNAKNQHYVCWCGYHKWTFGKKGSLQSAEISKQSLGSDLSWKKSNIFWSPPSVTICKSSLNFEGNWLLFMLLL